MGFSPFMGFPPTSFVFLLIKEKRNQSKSLSLSIFTFWVSLHLWVFHLQALCFCSSELIATQTWECVHLELATVRKSREKTGNQISKKSKKPRDNFKSSEHLCCSPDQSFLKGACCSISNEYHY